MTMLEERTSALESAYDHLASKADIEKMRGDLKTEMEKSRGDLKTEMEKSRGDLKTEMEKLRGDLMVEIRASETRIVKWGAGMVVGNIVAVAALLRLFS